MKFTSGKSEAEGGIDFRPPPSGTADWIEANYRLPATNLIAPGQLMKLTAWQRALCNDYDDPDVHEQVLKCPTQVGKTDWETAIVESEMDRRAGDIIFAMDTGDRVERLAPRPPRRVGAASIPASVKPWATPATGAIRSTGNRWEAPSASCT